MDQITTLYGIAMECAETFEEDLEQRLHDFKCMQTEIAESRKSIATDAAKVKRV